MKEDYHQQNQDSPPFMEKEYYRVVGDTPSESFTVEECYKVVGDTPIEGFAAEEYYKIIESQCISTQSGFPKHNTYPS